VSDFPQHLLAFKGLPGLLGERQDPAQEAEPRSRRQSVLAALGQMFGGQDDPSLSAEQNRAARNQALMHSGLATILASGPNPVGVNAAQILAQGAMAGQEAGALARMGMARQNDLADIQEAFGGREINRDMLQQLAMRLGLSGDLEGAKQVTELLKTLPEQTAPNLMWLPDVMQLVDPRTGETIRQFQSPDGSAIPPEFVGERNVGDKIEIYDRRDPAGPLIGTRPLGVAPGQAMTIELQAENNLTSQYNQQISPYLDVRDALNRMEAAWEPFKDEKNIPVADGTSIMLNSLRALAPQLRVRPGEQVPYLEEAGGVFDKLRAVYNRHILGIERVSPATAREAVEAARRAAEQAMIESQRVRVNYVNRARLNNLPHPEALFLDPFRAREFGRVPSVARDAPPPPPPDDDDLFSDLGSR
jgi:hypothetical protein